jgi:ribonuclease P/MRP protein subunit RPP40
MIRFMGQISQAFHYRDRHVFVKLYQQNVQPHLEFCTQAWSPWTAADKEFLERVQKRAVRMVSGLRAVEYEQRLEELGLSTLEERRHQADMQMVHKIMHKESGLDPQTWSESAGSTAHATWSRSDPFNIKVRAGRLEVRRQFFSEEVISDWNKISVAIQGRRGAAGFKAAYRRLQERPAHLA